MILSSFIFFLSLNIPKINLPNVDELVNKAGQFTQNSTFATYKDAAFAKESVNFEKGETIYVMVKGKGNGNLKKQARLLSSLKKEIESKVLTIQDQNVFTASFIAPGENGVYYIDVEIKDNEGTSFSGQRNINVASSNDQNVNSIREGVVNINTQEQNKEKESQVSVTKNPGASPSSVSAPPLSPGKNALLELFTPIKSFLERLLGLLKL